MTFKRRILSAILVVFILLCTGCSNQEQSEKDKELAHIREVASSYSELINGRTAIYSLAKMLSYYDDASYQAAKSEAKVSQGIAAIYFPSVKWEGSEFLASEQTGTITSIYVSQFTDNSIIFIFELHVSPVDGLSKTYCYQATYSVLSDEIYELTQIY